MSQVWISAAGLSLATIIGALLEVVPETHSHGFEKTATYALVLGFVTLVFLEMAF